MLDNLRKASGFEYTSKLQRMFVDKTLSRELHTGYIRVRTYFCDGKWKRGEEDII